MFKKIKEFFVGKPQVAETVAPYAPYKLPEPAMVAPVAAPAVVEVIIPETTVASVVVETPAPTSLAVVNAAEGSVVSEIVAEPAKKTRKPRAPKATPVAKEKAPAKAKAPKLTVVKAAKSKKV